MKWTDGVTEAQAGHGKMTGMLLFTDRVRSVSRRAAPDIELQQMVLGGLKEFTDGEYRSDDLTLLVGRRI